MSHELARISARLFNTPLLATPEAALAIAGGLAARLAPDAAPLARASADDPFDLAAPDADPYSVANGVATIPVHGELVNRGSFLNSLSGLTSYDSLRSALRLAAADPRVASVVLDMDSPGGEASGAMETAEEVRALSRAKPVTAHVNGLAASAAYAIASGAREIVVSPSATVGSIGVVWLHLDQSQAMARKGVKPTLLHAGAYKVDASPFAPLEEGARERIQAQIEDVYALFADTVGKMRPKLGADGARKTEAGLFMGQKAVDAGLADRVGAVAAPRFPRGDAPAQMSARHAMAVALNGAGESHASSLIDAGKVDRTSGWSFSAEDGDKLLGPDGDDWAEYGRFHLGVDDAEGEKTKARFKYPYGKDGKVYRAGLIAAKSRAGQQGEKEIEAAASRLLDRVDKNDKQEKEAAMADALALEAAMKEGSIAGEAAAAARIKAILDSEPAQSRPKLARKLALDTDIAPAVALGLLAEAAEEPRAASRMAMVPKPAVTSDSTMRQPDGQAEIDAMYAGFAAKLNANVPDRWRPGA